MLSNLRVLSGYSNRLADQLLCILKFSSSLLKLTYISKIYSTPMAVV